MSTMVLLSILLGISVAWNILLLYGVNNLMKQNESYEDYFDQLHRGLESVLEGIKSIDKSGAFESDDEVGIIFSGIKGMIDSLKNFLL